MIVLKTIEEIELIRKAALLVGKTLAEVGRHIRAGVTTQFLDQIGEQFIRDNGGIPLCKGYEGFPSALCISVNDVVVHGIPGNVFLKDGDNVSLDCVIELDGYVGDSAYTFAVGEISPEMQNDEAAVLIAFLLNHKFIKTGWRKRHPAFIQLW